MKPPSSPAVPHATIAEPQQDNIQILLARKAELAKNKAKYTLTEADAQLMASNSTEVLVEDGQWIVKEGEDLVHVYRIKSGKVHVTVKGHQFNIIGRGWYIGDAILVYDRNSYTIKGSMQAMGPVVLQRLDINFVRTLFKSDVMLHAKFMRFMASTFSFILEQVSNHDHPAIRGIHANDPSLSSSSSSLSITEGIEEGIFTASISYSNFNDFNTDSDLGSSGSITPPSPSDAANGPEIPHSRGAVRPVAKREVKNKQPFKSYPLKSTGNGVQSVMLGTHKFKAISKSFGFSHKTSIEYSKIESISKVGDAAATIIYKPHKVNLFFKQYRDREEFIEIANSLVQNRKDVKSTPEISRDTLSSPHEEDSFNAYEEVKICGGTEHLYKTMQHKKVFKKGEVVFEEGDLFQRIYTLTVGHCDYYQKGRKILTMEEGDIIGVNTILNLRPVPVSLVVASEEAEFLVIYAKDFNEMINHDPSMALALYRDAAQIIDRKIAHIMGYLSPTKRLQREKEQRDKENAEDTA